MLTVGLLCGGFGTRMGDVALSTPKALLEVAGKPILGHILDRVRLLAEPHRTAVVTNDHYADSLRAWIQALRLTEEVSIFNNGVRSPEMRLGSIGDIQFLVEKCGPVSDLLIIGSDNLFDFFLSDFLRFARSQGPSVAVYDVGDLDEARRFGVVTMEPSGRLAAFEEKPEHPKSTLIATCIYYFPAEDVPQIKEYLVSGSSPDKSGLLIAWLLKKKQVFGWKGPGLWFDIGNPKTLEEAQRAFGV